MRHFYIKKHLALLKSEGKKKKHTTAFMSHKPRLGVFSKDEWRDDCPVSTD